MLPSGEVVVRTWKGSSMGSGGGEREETLLRVVEIEEEDMLLTRELLGS